MTAAPLADQPVFLVGDQPVTILQAAPRGQVLVQTADGRMLLLHKSGLGVRSDRSGVTSLKVDATRGTDGAR